MSGKDVMRLILALTMLVSTILRPPGTMLVLDGDTITFELCTGGETVSVTMALSDDPQETIDLSCEFFSAQIAALPFLAPDVAPINAVATQLAQTVAPSTATGQIGWLSYSSRAPPFVS